MTFRKLDLFPSSGERGGEELYSYVMTDELKWRTNPVSPVKCSLTQISEQLMKRAVKQ
jgi:hypothetical protein